MDESSRMTVEKKKSQVNPMIPDSKYQFPLLCKHISLDASAEYLVINQDDTVITITMPKRRKHLLLPKRTINIATLQLVSSHFLLS